MELDWTHAETSDDSIAKQVLQWMPQGHRGRGRPRNTWKRDLEREMWIAGFRFSWIKMRDGSTRQSEVETSGLWPMIH